MSSYLSFFIRDGDRFLPIHSVSRSNRLYSVFEHYMPYEKVRPITYSTLQFVRDECDDELREIESYILQNETMLAEVVHFDNSVEDKLAAIQEIHNSINDFKEDKDELNAVKAYISALTSILDEADGTKYSEYEDLRLDPAHYLYAGIEVGYYITSEMIAE